MSPHLKAMWNTMECKRDSFNGSLGGASETHWECVSHCLKARWNTRRALWSAREIASVALSVEQERHTKCVSRCLKAMCLYSMCLSYSAESTTETISLALHSVSYSLKVRWNTYETLWSAREIASVALSAKRKRHNENMFHSKTHVKHYGVQER